MNEIDYSQLDTSIRPLVKWANANGFKTQFSCSGVDEDHPGDVHQGEFYLILETNLELVHRVVEASFAASWHNKETENAGPAEVLLYFWDGEPHLKLTVSDFSNPTDAEHCIKSLLIATSRAGMLSKE